MSAGAPSRASSSFTFTIGLVPISVDIFSGSEDSATKRSTYVRDGDLHPVGMTQYDKITGKNVARGDTIKCIEAADGTIVDVSDEEIQQLLTAENGDAEFIGFLKRGDFLENYVTEKLYQVRPQRAPKVGKTRAAKSPYEKPFVLFMKAMARKHLVGLLKYTSRGTTRYYAIHPNGTMYSLLFDEEVREGRPMPEAEINPNELAMAEKLLDQFTLADAPVFNDETALTIHEFVQAKAKAMANGEQVALPEVKAQTAENVDDLSALLAGSIQ
jgi:non-homologous end joining protein Ku